jgi:hypothetical protein
VQDLGCLQKRFLLRKTFGEVSLVMFVSKSCGVSQYVLGPGSLLVRAWFWLSRCALFVFPFFRFFGEGLSRILEFWVVKLF